MAQTVNVKKRDASLNASKFKSRQSSKKLTTCSGTLGPPQIIRESQSLTPRHGKGARVRPKLSPNQKLSESSLISKTKEKTNDDSISNSSELEDVVSESIPLNRVHKFRAT